MSPRCLSSRDDTPAELAVVREEALLAGAFDATVSNHWSRGGEGAIDLAVAVQKACSQPGNFQFLYDIHVSPTVRITYQCRCWLACDMCPMNSVLIKLSGLYRGPHVKPLLAKPPELPLRNMPQAVE